MKEDMWKIENEIITGGKAVVCGVDEAGRGPVAGPVCAAAVILPQNLVIDGLDDSKKLSEKKREELFDVIRENAVSYSIAMADVSEIERFNILEATFMAMNRAISTLDTKPQFALVDGNTASRIDIKAMAVTGGDGRCASIAAASILAKVTRDRYMMKAALKYPQYKFEKHKGYGTKLHRELILEHGTCPEHRPSFLVKFLKPRR